MNLFIHIFPLERGVIRNVHQCVCQRQQHWGGHKAVTEKNADGWPEERAQTAGVLWKAKRQEKTKTAGSRPPKKKGQSL